jgi:hypothetical protein
MFGNDEYNDYEEFEGFAQEADNSHEQMEILKDRLARANYMAIKTHGIDAKSHIDDIGIKSIIQETLEYFEELEEYEKCADLKKVLDQI